MKRIWTILALLVTTGVIHAQMMGPGYIVGNQQEKINHPKNAKIYKALYEAADKNDCATFKKILDTGISPNLVIYEIEGTELNIRYHKGWYDGDSDPEYVDYVDSDPGYRSGHWVPGHLSVSLNTVGSKRYRLYDVAEDAAKTGRVCILKELQKHKFNWKHPEEHGDVNLLYDATESKQIEVVKFFLALPGPEGDRIRWRARDVQEAQALVASAEQAKVKAEIKKGLQKKK